MQNLQEVKYTGTSQTAVIMTSINDTIFVSRVMFGKEGV